MRKVLAILLISLLSLQASWAAAASYCRHEQGAAARHFGHHEHRHGQHLAGSAQQAQAQALHEAAAPPADHAAGFVDAGDASDDGSTAASLVGADLDCSVCHAHALAGMPSAPASSALDATVVAGEALIQHLPPSRPQPRPERPDWLAA